MGRVLTNLLLLTAVAAVFVLLYAGTAEWADEEICVDMCGDGTCQEMVCQGTGCPCAETPQNCAQDCQG